MKKETLFPILIGVLIIAATAAILLIMGREPYYAGGYIKIWHGIVYSSENSQHLFDPYSYTHFIHGLAFYLLFWLIGRKWPLKIRLLGAIALACGWEILENSDMIINHYRAATVSLDYFGDSVINSVGDIIAAILGFIVAWKLPLWTTVLALIIIEIALLFLIRDNLTLNIIMLIHPIDAIKLWQLAG